MTAVPPLRAQRLWTPQGLVRDAVVERDASGRVTDVRPGRPGDGPALDGLVLPGLINAHAHLELSHLHRRVPGGAGFVPWVGALFATPPAPREDVEHAGRAAAVRARALGTAWLADVSNGGHTAPWLADAGLAGVVHHERLGLDATAVPAALAEVRRGFRMERGIVVRSSPHALFSTALELVLACLEAGPPEVPATIHVGESEHEAAFLDHGTGPHAGLLDRLGRDWRWWEPPGLPALVLLDRLGALGPGLLLVHGVRSTPEEITLAGRRGAPVCLCPRSNLHVGGRLPDAPAWLASGAPVCLGTDSLASNDDLDVLAEIPVLAEAFPDVPPALWLAAVTHGAAEALGLSHQGRIVPGARVDLLQVDADLPDLAARAGHGRRWIPRSGHES